MLSREDILSAYKHSKFPDKLFDESISKIKNMIFYQESTEPSSQKIKDKQKLSESYILPRRLLIQKNIQPNSNNKNEFVRGGNFAPKEPVIDIKIDNIKLVYDKFSLPIETNIIYIKNTYGGLTGPYNLEQIKNMYKNKKIDSNNEFRLIDIFNFKDFELFSFQSLKIINDEKWIDLIIDNYLINYSDLYKNVKNEEKAEKKEKKKKKEISNENKEDKEKKDKKENKETKEIEPNAQGQESEGKWEVHTKKKKKVKSKEIKEEKVEKKEELKKEDSKNVLKTEKNDSSEILEKKISKEKKDNEDLVEILKRKKKEKETEQMKKEESIKEEIMKQENENNEDKKANEIKETRSKKGKKKKKAQFEETEVNLGFQIK